MLVILVASGLVIVVIFVASVFVIVVIFVASVFVILVIFVASAFVTLVIFVASVFVIVVAHSMMNARYISTPRRSTCSTTDAPVLALSTAVRSAARSEIHWPLTA